MEKDLQENMQLGLGANLTRIGLFISFDLKKQRYDC